MASSELKLRYYESERDYPTVCEWWRAWDWPPIDQEILPEIGIVSEIDGVPAFCAWLYRTDSKMAWIGFPISNREVRKKERCAAIDAAIAALRELARTHGYTAFSAITNSKNLGARYEHAGMNAYDKNITHYLVRLSDA